MFCFVAEKLFSSPSTYKPMHHGYSDQAKVLPTASDAYYPYANKYVG